MDQYYSIAATTIFFYDFLLTLSDEVSRVIGVLFAKFIAPPMKGRIRVAGEEIMGYVGGSVARRTAFVDDSGSVCNFPCGMFTSVIANLVLSEDSAEQVLAGRIPNLVFVQ